MSAQILAEDEISRCIIWDKAFSGPLHTDDTLFGFGGRGPDNASHESGVLRSLAPNDEDVHRIGCKITSGQNTRLGEPPPGPKRRYYCGFRTAKAAEVALRCDEYEVIITQIDEDGEPAHVDIALFVKVEGKSARNTWKANASMALAEGFGPPVAHMCDCDRQDGEHPIAKTGVECLVSGLRDRWPAPVLQKVIESFATGFSAAAN